MAATEPPPSNLKERIAALQQRNGSPSPSPSPTPPLREASLTPPRGSLRDKIAKFERKGGVPIPRGSFAMGAPPPEDASTKSRELYGNRVAALGKGRPTAPGNSGHRVVTSPTTPPTSPSSRTSPDENAAESTAHLTPDSITHSDSPPSRRSSSGFADRPVGPFSAADGSDEPQEIAGQLATGTQFESLNGTRDAKTSEPSKSTAKPTISTANPPLPVSNSSSSTGLAVATLTRGDVSSSPLRETPSEGTPAGSLTTSIIYEASPTSTGTHTQERPPVVAPKSAVSTVQAHISFEQLPVKEATVDANSRVFRLDRPPQNGSPEISSMRSDVSFVSQLPSSSSNISSTDSSKGGSTSITSDPPVPNKTETNVLPPSSSTSASTIAFPTTISSTVPSASGNFDDSIVMLLPPLAEPGRRSFTAVVHRGDGDNRRDSRHSTTSRSSTVTPRPSSSSFKAGSDGGVVRSKRNFKHLGAVVAEPSPSPGPGDLGIGDLAALLQEAAWLEQRLYDENTTVTSALGEEDQKAGKSAPSPANLTKIGQATTPAPVVASSTTRTKGRGLTLGTLTSAPSSYASQSPIRSSPSAPSFQVHPDTSPTQPKSARGRKYFSLRNALRGPRLSVSSEMSSDDSAPVATPPSPSFDLVMQQTSQGNDTMSIRSMFSIRSSKSGKSDSAPGSLRLSPRRSVARASSFAERLLNRASKAKSMLDDSNDAIPQRSPMLPPIIPETPGSLISIAPISTSSKTETSFDRDIFDSFPNVPSEVSERSSSYLFPVPPKTGIPVEQDFRHSSTVGISTRQDNSYGKPDWLRTRQES